MYAIAQPECINEYPGVDPDLKRSHADFIIRQEQVYKSPRHQSAKPVGATVSHN